MRQGNGSPAAGASARGSEVAQALDAVDRDAASAVPVGTSGPRVAPYPLTPPLTNWAEPPPAFEPASAAPSSVLPASLAVDPYPLEEATDEVRVAAVERDDPPPAPVPEDAPPEGDARWLERASLADALRQTTSSESAYEAIESLLGAWKLEPLSAGEAASPSLDLPTIASRRGLDYLAFRGNLNVLRVLDLPVILELDLGDGAGVGFAMVDRMDDESSRVRIGRATFRMSNEVMSEAWFGQGHLLWYDADELGGVLARGSIGPSVRRLHALLAAAGVYRGPETDRFDAATEEAVVEFQRAAHLEADGKVGPMTMIALYGIAAPERVPHLLGDSSPVNVAATGASQ